MNSRALVLTLLVVSLPAAAKTRRQLVHEARDLISEALDTNDESDSECQQELESQLQRTLRLTKVAEHGSPRALRKAIANAESLRDSAQDDCPGKNTQEVLVPLNRAIHKLHWALNPAQEADDEDQDQGQGPQMGQGEPIPPTAPSPAFAPGIDVAGLSVDPVQYDGSRYAQVEVSGLHVRGMAGHDLVFSVAVKTFSGNWMQPVTLPAVRCDYDDCGWDQLVSFSYPEDALRAQNFDDGRFVAMLTVMDAQTSQPVGTRELDFRYGFMPVEAPLVQPVAPPPPVISVDVQPALGQPPPIEVAWAPPPMLVEMPPPQPGPDYYWVGGYWGWQGEWVWVSGHWRQPPSYGYTWFQPYYENRNGWVVFVPGHWQPAGTVFVPPAPDVAIVQVEARPGALMGPRPIGPPGVFVPPPPGSRPGVIIPAPVGTPPAVVVSAPPVINPGMRIQGNLAGGVGLMRASLTVVAPAGVTASGRPVQATVPAAPHLAAALPAVVRVAAPPPATSRPIPAFDPRRPAPVLPAAQAARVLAPQAEAVRVAAVRPGQRPPPPHAGRPVAPGAPRPPAPPPPPPGERRGW